MRNPFRRTVFRAKAPEPVNPAPTPEEVKLEIMHARVDIEDIPVTRTMQELAADIVKNPAFDTICRRLRSEQLKLLVSTTPEEIQVRESAAARIRALDQIVLALGALGFPEGKINPKAAAKR